MFFFLLVPEATPERVTSGKRKCGHVLKNVQDLGYPLCRLCGEGGRGGGAVGSEVFITLKLVGLPVVIALSDFCCEIIAQQRSPELFCRSALEGCFFP